MNFYGENSFTVYSISNCCVILGSIFWHVARYAYNSRASSASVWGWVQRESFHSNLYITCRPHIDIFSFEMEREHLHLFWLLQMGWPGFDLGACVWKMVQSSAYSWGKLLYRMMNIELVTLQKCCSKWPRTSCCCCCFFSFYNQSGRNICFDQSSFYFLLPLPPGTSFYHFPQLHACKHYKQVVKCLSHQI